MSRKKQRISDEFEEALLDIQDKMNKEFGLEISKTEATKIAAAKIRGIKSLRMKKGRRGARFFLE